MNEVSSDPPAYRFRSASPSHANAYLLPTVESVLANHFQNEKGNRRLFDLGCGNGSVASHFAKSGYEVTGVDPSAEGIRYAKETNPNLNLSIGSAYDQLAEQFGQFPAVISLEVVEHVYAPRDFAASLFALTQPQGVAVVSTPYHGYIKNLVLAASGKMDQHFTAMWDHGHIKFWSIKTLSTLLEEAGFAKPTFHRVGRVPALAKSMIAVARRDS